MNYEDYNVRVNITYDTNYHSNSITFKFEEGCELLQSSTSCFIFKIDGNRVKFVTTKANGLSLTPYHTLFAKCKPEFFKFFKGTGTTHFILHRNFDGFFIDRSEMLKDTEYIKLNPNYDEEADNTEVVEEVSLEEKVYAIENAEIEEEITEEPIKETAQTEEPVNSDNIDYDKLPKSVRRDIAVRYIIELTDKYIAEQNYDNLKKITEVRKILENDKD